MKDDYIKRSDAYRIALQFGSDVAAQKITELDSATLDLDTLDKFEPFYREHVFNGEIQCPHCYSIIPFKLRQQIMLGARERKQ